ncbi:carabin [Stigmatopora argus]
MLKPSSCTDIKKVSDEDRSGSEVSPELETDRFGFIVPSGSQSRMVSPNPQQVRRREAKWINIMDQWQSILLKTSNMVKVQCQKGIPTSLRAKCWPLLCGATNRMKHNKHLLQSLETRAALRKWVDIIHRDLDRQFPFHEMFLSKDGHGQQDLFRVLKAYTQYKPEEGYCQAQGPVAAVLLMNMPAEEAFWCLVQISERYLPGYYSPLLEGVLFDTTVLTRVLKKTCPSVHKHLQRHQVEPLMFATDWLMCLFARQLPFDALLRVWDLFFCNGVRVLLQVAVVLVRGVLGRAEQRKRCQGQMETLQKLRDVSPVLQKEDGDAFVAEVCAVPLSSVDLEKHTEKALAKWRKDRPASAFDPRGRCHGYRQAWARAPVDEEERETGDPSAPLAHSTSRLSPPPFPLQRWRKGGGVSARDGLSRHCSSGTNDWPSRYELNLQSPLFGKSAASHDSKTTRRPGKDPFDQNPCDGEPSNAVICQVQTKGVPGDRVGVFHKASGYSIQVPTILIQDFSDDAGQRLEEERANSGEKKRWWRREPEKRGKEGERVTKTEKEKERRKPQTRGKGFQVEKECMKSSSYAEAYF